MSGGSAGGRAFGDLIQPFQIETLRLRGRLVRLDATLAGALGGHDYPPAVAEMMAQGLVLSAGLASGLKYDGTFTLQTRGDGPLSLMIADVTSNGDMRGCARFDADRLAAAAKAPGEPVPRLLGSGHMAFTVDQGPDTERYQGITELEGATLNDCAHNYFRRSEQVDTAISLAARAGVGDGEGPRGAALIIQRLPPPDGAEADDEGWRRAVILMSSAGPDALLDDGVGPRELLYSLFHEDGVRVFRQRPLRHACHCSRQRVAGTLRAFPRREVEDMAGEEGRITVTCEFCKEVYVFDADDLLALYAS